MHHTRDSALKWGTVFMMICSSITQCQTQHFMKCNDKEEEPRISNTGKTENGGIQYDGNTLLKIKVEIRYRLDIREKES